uniref:Pyrin domain-containing protein n=1 Tax=Hucho hucho TaxID=62062 RepID=A0A4W5NKV8_9TELE
MGSDSNFSCLLDGFSSIPKSWLENKDRTDTVDKMEQTYNLDGAVTIALEILTKTNQNSLAKKFKNNTLGYVITFKVRVRTHN